MAKDWLDIGVGRGKPYRIGNTSTECRQLASQLPVGCTVHVESSGGYERTVVRALISAGVDVRVHDPLRVRRISQAMACRAKTDSLDARSLAINAALLRPRVAKPLEQEGLADHSRAIDELKAAASQFLVRARAAELDDVARGAYAEAAATLQKQAEGLEKSSPNA